MLRVESGEEMHDPRRRPGHPYPSKIPDLHQFVVNVGRAYVDVFTQSPERSSWIIPAVGSYISRSAIDISRWYLVQPSAVWLCRYDRSDDGVLIARRLFFSTGRFSVIWKSTKDDSLNYMKRCTVPWGPSQITAPNFVKVGQSVVEILRSFDFSRWRPSAILDSFRAYLDNTLWVGLLRPMGLYHCANFGYDRCSSFYNMNISIILTRLVGKCLFTPQKLGFGGNLIP